MGCEKELLNLAAVPQIKAEDVPQIELYMDQMLTFLNQRLTLLKREQEAPFITNTMVNNYTKAKLVTPATKKRYQTEHVLNLALVGQLKKVLSIQDLSKILAFTQENNDQICYELFLTTQKHTFDNLENELSLKRQAAENAGFSGDSVIAAMALQLATEAHQRTLVAEKLLDLIELPKPEEGRKKSK